MSQKFYISGMTCQSCEVVIERQLKKVESVKSVLVSQKDGMLEIDSEIQFSKHDLDKHLREYGYQVSHKPITSRRVGMKWGRFVGWMMAVFGLYWILDSLGLLVFGPSTSDPSGLIAVFIIGLVASVSSCTAVVGGLVVAVSSSLAKKQQKLTRSQRMKPHVYFNIGRLLGFAAFGAMIGLLGSVIKLSPSVNGLFVLLVAVFMVVLGANLLNLFPSSFIRMPKWMAHKAHDLSESSHPGAPMLLGALTFFLPCGFTQSIQLYALSLQDPVQASIVLFVFALGTLPALLGISSMTAFSSGKKLARLTKTAGVIVLVLGMSNAVNGAALMGYSAGSVFANAEAAEDAIISGGTQYIQMEITDSFTYAPDVLRVRKGVPVEWSIFGGEFLGCANTLISPGLGVNTYIRSGMNTVRFTPQKEGKFTFSCSMGMIRGTMIVTS